MESANLHLYDWVVGQTVFIGVTQRRPSLRSIAWGRYFRRAGAVACAARQNFPGAFLFAGPGAAPFRQKRSLEDPTRGILLFNARGCSIPKFADWLRPACRVFAGPSIPGWGESGEGFGESPRGMTPAGPPIFLAPAAHGAEGVTVARPPAGFPPSRRWRTGGRRRSRLLLPG